MLFEYSVNALFELGAAFMVALSAYKCYLNKSAFGASPWTTGFFACWGFWNLWYYPQVGDWFSFGAGVAVCLANLSWTSLLVYYSMKEDT